MRVSRVSLEFVRCLFVKTVEGVSSPAGGPQFRERALAILMSLAGTHSTSVHLRRQLWRETISAKQELLCQNRNIASTAIRIAIAANAKNPSRAAPMRDLRKAITSGRDRCSLRLLTRYRAVGNVEHC